jgi:hypothetical protein
MLVHFISWIAAGLIVGFAAGKLINLRGDDPNLGIGLSAATAIGHRTCRPAVSLGAPSTVRGPRLEKAGIAAIYRRANRLQWLRLTDDRARASERPPFPPALPASLAFLAYRAQLVAKESSHDGQPIGPR